MEGDANAAMGAQGSQPSEGEAGPPVEKGKSLMHIYSDFGLGVNELYPTMVEDCLKRGQQVVRGPLVQGEKERVTRELHPVFVELSSPRQRLVTSYGRPVNVPFALAEVLWILSGRKDVEMLSYYNSKIADYSDNGSTFNAAYGHRLRHEFGFDQLEDVIRTLRDDPATNQATLVISSPLMDRGWRKLLSHNGGNEDFNYVKYNVKDRACNVLAHLMIRNGKLDWLQVVRSNDIMWGTPYNWMQWTHIMEYVASRLRVPVGTYYHVADSLHMYDWHWEEATKVQEFNLYSELGSEGHPYCHAVLTASDLQEVCRLEELIRCDGRVGLLGAPLSRYWKQVLQVLNAHSYFKQKHNMAAFSMLTNGDPDWVYVAATLRFWWGIRWHKDPDIQRRLEGLRGVLGAAVLDWITDRGDA